MIDEKKLVVGKHTYGNPYIWNFNGCNTKVRIGHYTSIGPGVELINGGIHPSHWVSLYPFRINWNMKGAIKDGTPATKGDIVIGSDVWIGSNATILSGIKIGDGAIVGASSLVTSNVPEYAIVGGVPSKVIKYRFSETQIENLISLKWWNWPEDLIKENVDLLSSGRVDDFIAKAKIIKKDYNL